MSEPNGRAYFDANYPDYEGQTPSRKIRFYAALLGRWVTPGARVFELGVG
jgi:hypothetical protein